MDAMRIARRPTLKTFLLVAVVLSLVMSSLAFLLTSRDEKSALNGSVVELLGWEVAIVAVGASTAVWTLPVALSCLICSLRRLVLACFVVATIDASLAWSIFYNGDYIPWFKSIVWFYSAFTFWSPIAALIPLTGFKDAFDDGTLYATIIFLFVYPLLGMLFAKTCRREIHRDPLSSDSFRPFVFS